MPARANLDHKHGNPEFIRQIPSELNGVLLLPAHHEGEGDAPMHALFLGGGHALWYGSVSKGVPASFPHSICLGAHTERLLVRRASAHAIEWTILTARDQVVDSGTLAVEMSLDVAGVALTATHFALLAVERDRATDAEGEPPMCLAGLAPRRARARVHWIQTGQTGWPEVTDATQDGHTLRLDWCVRSDPHARAARPVRLTLDLRDASFEIWLHHESLRWPTLAPSLGDRPPRFLCGVSDESDSEHGPSLVRVDCVTGHKVRHAFGFARELAPAVFAPRDARGISQRQLALVPVYDAVSDKSECVILDLERFDRAPLACVRLPARIGSHARPRWFDVGTIE